MLCNLVILCFRLLCRNILSCHLFFIFFGRLSNCCITEEGYKALALALKSTSSLSELDLTGNDPGPSGVKQLSDLLQSRWYSLKTLR